MWTKETPCTARNSFNSSISALFSAAVAEAPDRLEIVSSVAMCLSGAKYPVALYRSAIRLMDPDFDGSAKSSEKMADYLNRICCYPVVGSW